MGTHKNNAKISPSTNAGGLDMNAGAPLIWQNTIKELKRLVSPTDFERYISELKCVAERDGTIVLAARSRLLADRINDTHSSLIKRTWKRIDPRERPVRLIAWDRDHADYSALVDDPWASEASEPIEETPRIFGERADFTFDTLITGAFNQQAHDLLRHIQTGEELPSRMVFIHGLQGVGKTHLVTSLQQAIMAADSDERSVVYTTAEDFQNAYVEGVMARDTRSLKARLASGSIVILEDLQTIADSPGTDREFARNLRNITERGGLVIVTADTSPSKLEGFSTRVMSQLRGAMAVHVHAPDKEMRKAIVARRAHTLAETAPSFQVSDEMIDMICARVRGQGRELCGALISLYSEAGMGKTAPTLGMLKRVLDQMVGDLKPPSIDLIKRATMRLFEVTKAELEGRRKMQRVVYPRHLAMFLCRELTDKSYPTIARSFGGRDHTSILYAAKRTGEYLETREDTAIHLEQLRELIYEMQA